MKSNLGLTSSAAPTECAHRFEVEAGAVDTSFLLTGADLAEELPDFVILGAAGVILCTLAVVAFRANEAYARRRGSLAQY